MASYFSKSKFIMQNLKSRKFLTLGFINRTSSITSSQFPPHLLNTTSFPPLPARNYASSSRINSSIAFARCFASVSGGRGAHTATSVRNDVDQIEFVTPDCKF
ncbi:hypothetical protein L2E82_29340 [Cichorium intybus]|uniref:Uncharacterized protein n=1 Tax=Cichorium intybus TaxID=13427 RepID=A0ACB9CXU4_CICIN|nr:hypothetical protein L2E82_29340 [Cichorium intybus]